VVTRLLVDPSGPSLQRRTPATMRYDGIGCSLRADKSWLGFLKPVRQFMWIEADRASDSERGSLPPAAILY